VASDTGKRDGCSRRWASRPLAPRRALGRGIKQQASLAIVEFRASQGPPDSRPNVFRHFNGSKRLAFAADGHGGQFTHKVKIHYLWRAVNNLPAFARWRGASQFLCTCKPYLISTLL